MERARSAAEEGNAASPNAPDLRDAPTPGDVRITPEGHRVELYSRASLPTRHGDFLVFAFKNSKEPGEHIALVRGDVWGQERVPVRLHSECLTGDVFGSLKCDCRDQLERALDEISRAERGLVLYMRQEGRGIGLANKIRAYDLQDQGLDTVEANLHLGFDDDMRAYDVAAEMLKLLRLKSVVLMTNNLNKVEGLSRHGVTVADRVPIQTAPNEHNQRYLKTKRAKSGHVLTLL